jgi:ferredoxin
VPLVRVEPAGVDIPVEPGQTIIAAALAAGHGWPTVCGGVGSCRTCFLRVRRDQADRLSPIERWEREGLDELGLGDGGASVVRLACQARVLDDVVVTKPGVRPAPS